MIVGFVGRTKMEIGRREFLSWAGAAIASSAMAKPIRSSLGGRLEYKVGENLPYDSEVEYLEGTGPQWIDTGIIGNERIAIDVKWSYVSTSAHLIQWGARTGVNKSTVAVPGYYGTATDTRMYPTFGTHTPSLYTAQSAVGNNLWACHLERRQQDLYKDGELVLSARVDTSSFSTINTIPLFAFWDSPTQFLNRTGGRIWLCKIWQDDALIRDYVPVRFTNENISAEGAMFDRVSGQLFRNQGTGSFIIGPDIS